MLHNCPWTDWHAAYPIPRRRRQSLRFCSKGARGWTIGQVWETSFACFEILCRKCVKNPPTSCFIQSGFIIKLYYYNTDKTVYYQVNLCHKLLCCTSGSVSYPPPPDVSPTIDVNVVALGAFTHLWRRFSCWMASPVDSITFLYQQSYLMTGRWQQYIVVQNKDAMIKTMPAYCPSRESGAVHHAAPEQ